MSDEEDRRDNASPHVVSESGTDESEENVAKRRSKNRVNARRSRERKRLMLDALQNDHWKLHQDNKRIKTENMNLRKAIDAVKALKENQAAFSTSSNLAPMGSLTGSILGPSIAPSTTATLSGVDSVRRQGAGIGLFQEIAAGLGQNPLAANAEQTRQMDSLLLSKLLDLQRSTTLPGSSIMTSNDGALLAALGIGQNPLLSGVHLPGTATTAHSVGSNSNRHIIDCLKANQKDNSAFLHLLSQSSGLTPELTSLVLSSTATSANQSRNPIPLSHGNRGQSIYQNGI